MIKNIRLQLKNEQMSKNISYTVGSFFILAISGVIINVLITTFRDPTALGVFNLTYAIYIIVSQIATLGIHYSVLRHAAFFQHDKIKCSEIYFSAIFLTIILGVLSAFVVYQGEHYYAFLFHSAAASKAIAISALGLIFFPLNKVLLSYINAFQHMKVFSLLQSLRYIIVMIVVSAIAASKLPIQYASFCFPIAEIITSTLTLIYIHSKKLVIYKKISFEWVKIHLTFGSKGLLAGLLVEINSRLDILVISIYLPEYKVGIYSFAAMLVDGLYHIIAMIRINFNPILVNFIKEKKWDKMTQLKVNTKKYLTPTLIIFSIMIMIGYYFFAIYVAPGKHLQEGFQSLLVLLSGLMIIGHLIPFDNLMIISGHPGYQTVQQLSVVIFNLIITILLLPSLDILGAAIGTVAGNLVGITFVILFTNRIIGWKLLKNNYQEAT